MIKDYLAAKVVFEKKQLNIDIAVRAVYKEYAKQKDVVSTGAYRISWSQWYVRSYKLSEYYVRLEITHTRYGDPLHKNLKLPAIFVEFAAELDFEQLEKAVSLLIAAEGVDILRREQALELKNDKEKLAREDALIAAAEEIINKRSNQ
jgi:hypothetical protein